MSQGELWLLRLYPVVAVMAPVLFVPFYLRQFDTGGAGKSGFRRLLFGAIGVTAVIVLAQTVIEAGRPNDLWRIIWSITAASVGGLVLFLFFVRPVLTATIPASHDLASSNIRSATLVPRHRLDPVPMAVWLAAWGLYSVVLVLVAQAVSQGDHPLKLAGLVCWPAAALAAKLSLTDPEPLTPNPSTELLDALAILRTQRVWLLFGIGFGLNSFLMVSTIAVRVGTWRANLLALVTAIVLTAASFVWSARLFRQQGRVRELLSGRQASPVGQANSR